MTVHVRTFEDAAQVAATAAAAAIDVLAAAIDARGEAHIMLTGGTVGIATIAAIGKDPKVGSIDWQKVHFWWGDERFVAPDSPDRNALQAKQALLDSISTDPFKVHEFPSTAEFGGDLDEAAAGFAAELAAVAPGTERQPRFDVVFMGMGPDGHVASLFPGKDAPAAGLTVIAEHDSPKPPPQRLSFTYEVLNAVESIWFLVAGADKADAAAAALGDSGSTLPAARVKGTRETVWFIDQAAASKLG